METTFPRTAGLLARLLVRRFVNRLGAMRGRRKKGARTGTARKSTGNPVWGAAILGVFVLNAFLLSSTALHGLAGALGPVREAHGRVLVSSHAYRRLVHDREQFRQDVPDFELKYIFNEEFGGTSPGRESVAAPWIRVYRDKGLAGFAEYKVPRSWYPHLLAWQSAELRPVLVRSLGLLLLVLAACQYFMALGTQNQNLGRVEWSTEWLFSLPASARALFGAQILGYALVDGLAWVVTVPFLAMVYLSGGAGGWAAPAALASALCVCLVIASLRVGTETFLRKRFSPAPVKNLQAVFSLLGVLLFFLAIAATRSPLVLGWIVNLARNGPGWLAWNPFAQVADFCGRRGGAILAGEIGIAAAVPMAATWYCAHLVRDGLISAPGENTGSRGRPPAGRREILPAGIVGKDLRLLLRDRTFCVQTLVTPLLIVGFQVFLNPVLVSSVGKSFQGAATFCFGVGAYVLMYTGATVLAVEGNALWMLYGLPVPLDAIMVRKTQLWMTFAALYTGIALAVCAYYTPALEVADFSYAVAALVGVVICAFISSGLGILATDPLETEVKRRVRPGSIYLYMLLAGSYGYALRSASTWMLLGEIVLTSLLAYALWQKVKDRAPYLLDPVSAPPPQISLADGLVAALAFFVLQGVAVVILLAVHLPTGDALVLAFSIAGALAAAFMLFAFWRRGVPDLPASIGLQTLGRGKGGAIVLGLAVGIAAGGLGVAYLVALDTWPQLRELRDSAREVADLQGWGLVVLGVAAAPVFEEFIFRGLVYRGLRRSLPVGWSILASASIFAFCHPPVSVIPVFTMAALAAWSFERTGWLGTPICVHAVYNALVLVAGAELQRH